MRKVIIIEREMDHWLGSTYWAEISAHDRIHSARDAMREWKRKLGQGARLRKRTVKRP